MLTTIAICNYRSIRNLVLPLGRLNVVTGPNGSGKSSVYRALRLLSESARGGLIPSLAREGGLESTLWAGPQCIAGSVRRGEHPVQGTARTEPVNLRLGFSGDEFGYAIDLGLPGPSDSAFAGDPEIKRECLWSGPTLRPSTLLVDRRGPSVRVRDGEAWSTASIVLASFEGMAAQLADPKSAMELIIFRERLRSWRFYDNIRSDVHAPARLPQVGTHTPILGDDGSDLAAALQTIIEIGDSAVLGDMVRDAFPGSQVIPSHSGGRFEVTMTQHGLLRPLRGSELSDGTLKYLMLVAALLSPRPPSLLVLNEPESSLHPDLLLPLSRLIAHASQSSQVIVVSHAIPLVAALERYTYCESLVLEKSLGETRVVGTRAIDAPLWYWPKR